MGIDSFPPGFEQFDDYVDVIPAISGSFASFVLGQNIAYYTRFRVARPIKIAKIRYYVGTTQHGNVDVGIFSLVGSALTLLGSSGSTAQGSTSAVQTVNLTAAVTLVPGVDYCSAIVSDSATATSGRIAGVAAILQTDNSVFTKASQFPLATTTTAGIGNTASLIFQRMAV